jgi:ACR3 family arsenite efflux pump ArsB
MLVVLYLGFCLAWAIASGFKAIDNGQTSAKQLGLVLIINFIFAPIVFLIVLFHKLFK